MGVVPPLLLLLLLLLLVLLVVWVLMHMIAAHATLPRCT
jgi:hypothetical protein